jgi:hypothetical protein
MTMERDPELDRLLAPLQGDEPDELALRRWQRALARVVASAPQVGGFGRAGRWAIAAALLLVFGAGFGAGALVFRRAPAARSALASNLDSAASATEEHVYAKAD